MTKSFFSSVVRIPSYSKKEGMVVDFIRRWAKGHRCRFRQDGFGNVYLTKGSAQYFVCLSNHVDTVHRDQEEMVDKGVMKELEWKGDVVTAKNPVTGKQTGLGGDDLCGCAIALAVLAELPVGKAVFTVQEELGCAGAKSVDKSFFEDVSFVVGSDSPEFNRATRYSSGVLLCGEELFEKHVKPICAKHGVTNWKSEPLCDCQIYRKIDICDNKHIDCVNLGNGALNPHQDTEYAKFSEVCAAEDLVRDLCTSIPTDKRWTSGYKEEERLKRNPYSYGGSSPSRLDSYRDWMSKYRQPEQREFDFKASPDDREFVWEFRNGKAAANLYVRRVGGLLAPEVRVEKEGEASVRVTGPERRLMAAFRFAYNYDNGTSFMDWEQFEKAVPRAKVEFERALAEGKPADDGLQPSPMERSDSELCSVDVTLSDPDSAPDFAKALSEKGIDADPDDDGYGTVNLYGTLGDLKRAYVEWWNLEENSSYGSWGEFAKAEPLYADAFFDDVEFQDEDSGVVVDAEFAEISENAGWLSRYRSGTPL